MNEHEEKTRGEHAARLLADPLLIEALDLIEKQCFDAFKLTEYGDKEKREELWVLQRNAARFRQIFTSYVAHGKYADAVLKQQKDNEKKKHRGSLKQWLRLKD